MTRLPTVNVRSVLRLVVAAGVAAVFVLPLGAIQRSNDKPPTRVRVVAVRDSRLLTVCATHEVTTPSGTFAQSGSGIYSFSQAPTARVAIFYGGRKLDMPRAAQSSTSASRIVEQRELDRERLVPDATLQAAIEQEVARLPAYALVPTTESADIVFVAESFYVPMTFWTAMMTPDGYLPADPYEAVAAISKEATMTRDRKVVELPEIFRGYALGHQMVVGGDFTPNFPEALLGVAVPADVYRRNPGDAAAMLAASVWKGSVFYALGLGMPDAVVALKSRRPFTLLPVPPSAASLVAQFAGTEKPPEDRLPLCAISEHSLDVSDGAESPASNSSPREAMEAAPAVVPGERQGTAKATFRSAVTYVAVSAVVADPDGKVVADLGAADFRLFEDGVEQKIDRVITTSAPEDIALLVDTSASMRLVLSQVEGALVAFAGSLPADDRLLPVSFDDRVLVQSEFTSDRGRLRRGVFQMQWGGGTRLYDAIELVAAEPLAAIQPRKAMVVFTDGLDTRSRLADAGMSTASIEGAQFPVYVVYYARPYIPWLPDTRLLVEPKDQFDYLKKARTQPSPESMPGPLLAADSARRHAAAVTEATAYLQGLADASGGRLFPAASPADLGDALSQVARELRSEYTICYYPSNQARDGTRRQLRLEVNRTGAVVRARTGYLAPNRQ
jgi:VWFA-related protein